MSWFVLAPTIAIAVILAAAILLRPGDPTTRINFRKGAGEAESTSNALPTFSVWLLLFSGARQPVWPIDYSDLSDRARRGMKVAGVMVIIAPIVLALNINGGGLGIILAVITAIPIAAIVCVISVTHSLVLRLLPYRGAIVSTAIGTLLGIAAALSLGNALESLLPRSALVFAGVVYGFIIGIIELSIAQEKAEQSQSPTVS